MTAIYGGVVFGRLPRTIIEVRGEDRKTFLHNLCTNEIKALKDGHGCEAFFTNVQGKTLCHALLFCFADHISIVTDPGLADQLLPHLDKYLIREDVQLVDRSSEVQIFLVSGTGATDQLGQGLDESLQHIPSPTVPNSIIAHVPFAKPGYFVFAPNEIAELLHEPLSTTATEIGPEAIEWLRISAGFPSNGRDVTLDNLPQEIDRNEFAINFEKGCYLGQETVARLDALGHVNKKLVRLEFDFDNAPPDGTEIRHGDKSVGKVTSTCSSPQGSQPVGLGIVRVKAIESGEPLSTEFGTIKVHP